MTYRMRHGFGGMRSGCAVAQGGFLLSGDRRCRATRKIHVNSRDYASKDRSRHTCLRIQVVVVVAVVVEEEDVDGRTG